MTTSRLAAPPPEIERQEPLPERVPPRRPPARAGRVDTSYGRVLRWSLLLSLVIHAGLLLFTGDFLSIDPLADSRRAAQDAETFSGLDWMILVPEGAEGDSPPAASSQDPPEPAPQETPSVVRVRPGDPGPEPSPEAPVREGAPAGPGRVRDALRPGYRDPRLYVDVKGLGVKGEEKSAHEQYMEHLQARIDAVNDSMGAVAARERAAKDWTFRDKNGKRWGVSEEGVHLGGLTIPKELVPVPRATGDNQSIEAERERQRQREEIRRQEEQRERRDTLQERSRAIRERRGGGGNPGGGG